MGQETEDVCIRRAYFARPWADMLAFKSLRVDFLSSQKLLVARLLQKKSIMQVLAANILMRISIVKLSAKMAMTGKPT